MVEMVKAIYTNPVILTILGLDILFLLFYKKINPWFIGKAGEHWTKQILRKLPKEQYIVLNDLLLQDDNYTHQIDHLVISKYGLFVIETKQYNGFIKGNKYDKQWTRYLKNGEKIFYNNPIRQNYGHVKCISKLINIDEKYIFNIVCIPSRAKLDVVNDGELTRYDTLYDKITSHKDIIISDIDLLVNTISKNNILDKKIRKNHNKNVSTIKDYYSDKCPKCGGKLIVRNGKYGSFYGCSNYPKCKYTRDIEG